MLGHPLAFSFSGLVVGSVIYSLPFAVQPMVAGFAAVNPALVDAARLLGAGSARVVWTLLAPLARRSLMTAAVLSFLHTVGEFGVVLMLGGDIPGATRTLSIVLYDQVENFDYAAAGRTAAVLLSLSLVALVAMYTVARRAGGPVLEVAMDSPPRELPAGSGLLPNGELDGDFWPFRRGKKHAAAVLAGLDRESVRGGMLVWFMKEKF